VERVQRTANTSKAAADAGDWVEATNRWIATEIVLLQEVRLYYYVI
jgi:hypothetical protein